MEAKANLERRVHHLKEVGQGHVDAQAGDSSDKVQSLRRMTVDLLRQLHSLGEVRDLDVGGGIDFYDEVRRFEIDLIQCALAHTGGHQRRAAELLKLKVTTLNSKIKQYNIQLNALADASSRRFSGNEP